MTITEIKRISLTPQGEVSDMDAQLRLEAEEVLGWKSPEGEKKILDPLRKALVDCGIEILNWKDVLQYKLERKHEAETEEVKRMLVENEYPRWMSLPDWHKTELEHYGGYIPSHVVLKMVQLKRALPEVQFTVEALMNSPDPFLIAWHGGKNDWDEGRSWEYIEMLFSRTSVLTPASESAPRSADSIDAMVITSTASPSRSV